MKRIAAVLIPLAACLSTADLQRAHYDHEYQLATQLCGRPQAAFQSGYNQGYAGDKMDSEWTGMCVPPAQAEASNQYQTGFLAGAQNAPVRVVHTVNPIHVHSHSTAAFTSGAASECTFDSDCGGGGMHCRDHTCMGYGGQGDRCVFNEDCSSDHCFGGTCRE
jgi:hypothetical protein